MKEHPDVWYFMKRFFSNEEECTPTQARAFAILCSLTIHQHPDFHNWAQSWLNGENPDARPLYDEFYVDPKYDIPGRSLAIVALASVLAPSGADLLESPQYYAAAAGWGLDSINHEILPCAQKARIFEFPTKYNESCSNSPLLSPLSDPGMPQASIGEGTSPSSPDSETKNSGNVQVANSPTECPGTTSPDT